MPQEGDIVVIDEAGKTTVIDSQEAFSDFIHSSCTQNVTYAIAHMLLLRIEELAETLRKLAIPNKLFISEADIDEMQDIYGNRISVSPWSKEKEAVHERDDPNTCHKHA